MLKSIFFPSILLKPNLVILFIDSDKPIFKAGENSKTSNILWFLLISIFLFLILALLKSRNFGDIFFRIYWFKYIKPVPLGPLRYFLPDVIRNCENLFIQFKNFDKINFISNKSITSKIEKFNKQKIKKNYNCIVCIENADPGYDFLFNKNIKGLITKYGGLNSHMAIRCSELNLPSLIGVGEKNSQGELKAKRTLESLQPQ